MFNVEMLPAGHGDGLLIKWGSKREPHYALVDGGPFYTHENIEHRLGKLQEKTSLLDLLVVTHVDGDHIEGFVKAMQGRGIGLTVSQAWFNGWRHLPRRNRSDLLGPVAGEYMSALIGAQKISWNKSFDYHPVMIDGDGSLPVRKVGGLELTLLSPRRLQLKKLRRVWKKKVEQAGLAPGVAGKSLEHLAKNKRLRRDDLLGDLLIDVPSLAATDFKEDNSVANGSSIAFIARYRAKSCLFCGDAHASLLEQSIDTLLAETGAERLKVDAVKLGHHGSRKSVSPGLLEKLDCKKFLVSTNGKYFKHPDREAIARVIHLCGPDVNLFFNYGHRQARFWDSEKTKKAYAYRTTYPANGDVGGLIVKL